jgi:lantibiotic modifying enzyme
MSAEHNDLWNDNIPVFTTSPGTRDIQTGSGVEIKDFLDEPSLFLVRRRLLNVSEDELERQIRIIKASFAISPAVGN